MVAFTSTTVSAKCTAAQKTVLGSIKPSSSSPVVRRAVVCEATEAPVDNVTSRRSVAAALAVLPVLCTPAAWALIPDDDDEELLEKAKAKRKTKIAEGKKAAAVYAGAEGGGPALVGVQLAVAKLAKSGAELAAGDLASVAATVGDANWVQEFEKSAAELSTSPSIKDDAQAVVKGLASLGAAAAGGKASEAKKSYVKAVNALETWVAAAGIRDTIKGL